MNKNDSVFFIVHISFLFLPVLLDINGLSGLSRLENGSDDLHDGDAVVEGALQGAIRSTASMKLLISLLNRAVLPERIGVDGAKFFESIPFFFIELQIKASNYHGVSSVHVQEIPP